MDKTYCKQQPEYCNLENSKVGEDWELIVYSISTTVASSSDKRIKMLENKQTNTVMSYILMFTVTTASSSGRLKNYSKKKSRVILSAEEKRILLKAYSAEPYPSQNTVHDLARKLSKKPSTIVNWFHNYRYYDVTWNQCSLSLVPPDANHLRINSEYVLFVSRAYLFSVKNCLFV